MRFQEHCGSCGVDALLVDLLDGLHVVKEVHVTAHDNGTCALVRVTQGGHRPSLNVALDDVFGNAEGVQPMKDLMCGELPSVVKPGTDFSKSSAAAATASLLAGHFKTWRGRIRV